MKETASVASAARHVRLLVAMGHGILRKLYEGDSVYPVVRGALSNSDT